MHEILFDGIARVGALHIRQVSHMCHHAYFFIIGKC